MSDMWSKVRARVQGLARHLPWSAEAQEARAEARRQARAERRAERVALVKSRPATLEQRYRLLDHVELADEVFARLKRRVADAVQARQAEGGAFALIEAGKLAPGRPYFFLKPLSRKGWLFERSGAGWVVSRAEKIVAQDLFLREGAPLDSVQLFLAADQKGYPRVRSAHLGEDLLSLAVYEQRVLTQMGLG